MHQTISQRRAILEALRQRCTLSTAEFYNKVDRLNPAPLHRFNVIPNGNNQFGVVERESGIVHQVCTGHGAACKAAQRLETAPTAKAKAGFATLMLRWTGVFCVGVLMFAFYGAQP
jgi:hypothetical protein